MNFDDYKNTKTYYDWRGVASTMRNIIHEAKMTSAERETALAAVPKQATARAAELNKEYYEEEARLTKQFYLDCRVDLGYDRFLTEVGCTMLEGHAWSEGHSNGFSDVHSVLSTLTELLDTLKDEFKAR